MRDQEKIEFLNTKGVLLQKHFVILHLLVEFASSHLGQIVLKNLTRSKLGFD